MLYTEKAMCLGTQQVGLWANHLLITLVKHFKNISYSRELIHLLEWSWQLFLLKTSPKAFDFTSEMKGFSYGSKRY